MFGRDSCQTELILTLCSYLVFQQKIGLFLLEFSLFSPPFIYILFQWNWLLWYTRGLEFYSKYPRRSSKWDRNGLPDLRLHCEPRWCMMYIILYSPIPQTPWKRRRWLSEPGINSSISLILVENYYIEGWNAHLKIVLLPIVLEKTKIPSVFFLPRKT